MRQHKEEIGTRQDLALYRIQAAKSDLKSARILLTTEEFIQLVERYLENK